MNCPLCSLVQDHSIEPWVVHENSGAVVFLHDDWATLGHAVVASTAHVENLSDLNAAERDGFIATYAAVERALLEATGCERAIIVKLGLAVPHLHLHIYPVSRDALREDVMAAIDMKSRVELSDDEKSAFAQSIRSLLSTRRSGA